MAASSSHPSKMAFDVFISFNRDEKDRLYQQFTKELYESLCRWGMKVFMDDDDTEKFMYNDDTKVLMDDDDTEKFFMDDDDTEKFFMDDDTKKVFMNDGVYVSDEIVKAIEGSKTAIVVLSKGYASSNRCLVELVKIVDHIPKTAYPVLPRFYQNPDSLRWHYFLEKYENLQKLTKNKPKVKTLKKVRTWWKEALSAIRSFSGVNLPGQDLLFPNKSEVMKLIFDKLLHLKLVAENRYFVEMPHRLITMKMLLGLTSKDVRLIGIVGMGGIGKTIIARSVYDSFAPKFKHSCCVLHIAGRSIVSLQRQILSQLGISYSSKILDKKYGEKKIKQYLRSRGSVLFVFDGINEKSQLEMLAGRPDWFGAGSRIIVTTRNKDILRQTKFKDNVHEYNVELLSDTSAFSLFCKHAFGDHHPPTYNLEVLCNEIIEKVGALPLALEKIASYLYGQDIDKWEDTLKNYHKVVYDDLFSDVLKSSYEGLESESQQIFLDLACFLNGEKLDKVIEILEGFGYSSPHNKLQLLADRCLIDISDEQIQMHILILCMAQQIVRQQLGTGQQSRIWLRGDARRLFYGNYELKYVHGIVMDLEEEEELALEAKSFADMSELKILQINNVQISEDIEYLSNKLTLLNWPGYPSKYLPSTFEPPPLLELHLPGSNVERLWSGTKKFENLKEIEVSDSKYLIETPDFSEVRKLRRIIMRNCGRLRVVHPSINSLERLVLLDMEGCVSFTRFSSAITCKRLKTLVLSNSGLEFFPEFGCCMEYLTELHIDGTSINQLSPSITYLSAMVLLNLKNCISLSSLPTEMGSLSSLKTLILNGCENLREIPPSLGNVEPLEELDIGGTSISRIPFSKNLRILNCERLKSNIWHSLDSLPTDFSWSLKDLNLSNCNLVDEDIPNDLDLFSTLEILDLSSNHFESLSESIGQLINLKVLYLNDCHKLRKVPKLPESLQHVGGEKSLDMLQISQGSSANTAYLPSVPPLIPLVPSCKTLVGIESQVEKVCNLLDLERPDNVLVVGIFGLDGSGKTSIAEAVFNTIADKFEGSCFVYTSKQNNLVSLKHQMLSQLLSKEITTRDDDNTEEVVRQLPIDRKVLIVLDGVDERKQIEDLVGNPELYAPGSRVIITSRNRDVLHQLNNKDEVQEYMVELLSHESAYSLFCKYAFGDGPFDKNDLCKEIVEKLGRLPLALKTIGSYLHNKELVVWNETLKRLSEVEQDFFDTVLQRSEKNLNQHLGHI